MLMHPEKNIFRSEEEKLKSALKRVIQNGFVS
jgi:hypothetical protein